MRTVPVSARASRFIQDALVWDNHACMPLRPHDQSFLDQLRRVRDAGVDVVSLNVGFGPQPLTAHLLMLASFRDWLHRHDDAFALVRTVTDIESARARGLLSVCFDVEGMAVLDGREPGIVALLHELGVRWMLIAYNNANSVGSGCLDTEDGGLTPYGREILGEMARVGMVVCCSHTGRRTALDVMEHAGNPVIFSHSNAKAVWDHPRNIDDELIVKCAATGGVVGINGIGDFLGANDNGTWTYIRHLDHAVQLVGPDHVGIALDYVFDSAELNAYLRSLPEAFPGRKAPGEDVRFVEHGRLGEIADALLARGYGEADLRKIFGGNWLRVARQVWPGQEKGAGPGFKAQHR